METLLSLVQKLFIYYVFLAVVYDWGLGRQVICGFKV